MASTADAEAALAALLAGALATLSVPVKTVRGWPSPSALQSEISAGNVVVSVYRLAQSRNTTRYLAQYVQPVIPAPTLTVSVTGGIATFAGVASLGQVAGVISNGVAYPVRTQANDTPAAVAGRIVALMPPPAMVSGASVLVPGLTDARTAADATMLDETGRQENVLQADLWCPTPPLRDQAEALAVRAVSGATYIAMPDGTACRMRLQAVLASDETSNLTIYRLMLRATAEIILGPVESAAIVLWPEMSRNGGPPVLTA